MLKLMTHGATAPSLFPAPSSLVPNSTARLAVPFGSWLPRGSIVELSGAGHCAHTSMAVSIMTLYQRHGEPVAWVQRRHGALFPPDLKDAGVELDALVVVQVPGRRQPAAEMARACELLLRSGSFGLVVADFSEDQHRHFPRARSSWTSRLASLCRQHESCLVLLSSSTREESSLGALVGIRAQAERLRIGPGRFLIDPFLLRSKGIHSEFALRGELRRGPAGLA